MNKEFKKSHETFFRLQNDGGDWDRIKLNLIKIALFIEKLEVEETEKDVRIKGAFTIKRRKNNEKI
jgi:hypothetical protein